MMRIIEFIQFFILTVDGKRVLGQIVCTDTEEVNHFSKSVTDDRCRRSLNHDSLLRNLVLDFLLFEFCLYLSYDLIDFLNFLCRGDHRIHDGEISVNSCTEKCAKLCFENIFLRQADTDRTISQCRVILIAQVEVIHLFVSTDIQSTDDNLLSCHHLYGLLVSLELFFLRREIIPSKIKKFTSEKADSTGIIFENITNISNASDICINVDLMAI